MDDERTKFIDISPQRILVIKLSSLGDIVHALPAVAALRQRFPLAHICWLVKSQWASILEGNPDINEVWSVDVSWKDWPMVIQGLRRRQCDLVVDFQGLFRTGLFGMFSGASMRVGFAQAREGAPWMYTHRVALPGDQQSSWRLLAVHAVDRNLALVRLLGADISQPLFHFPDLAQDHSAIGEVLSHAHIKGDESLIALAPWSRSALKSWPLSRFLQLAEKLVRLPRFRVVVLGGPAETQAGSEFRRLESQGLINLVGKLSLRQLPALLQKMVLVVGNDSSLIHLAAGVGTPVFAIFGPTHPKATGPYPLAQHVVCRTELSCSPCGQGTCRNSSHLECLHSISVDTIFTSIQETLVSSPS
ncbi:MAG: glycosyltransferase family 9 protein [Nitrospirota bacterium]|nr:glycosyltransferase family 9 protein [Nitrospirota bacterium]MDH5586196.1 glycosyltransferase family 9 protein [Nitrospirota bacterium]MDH5775043.1 glycosyltransferase family 9 protein [Nitrospirota bacterium]